MSTFRPGGRAERGVALISAMIVVALATVIAATLFFDSAMAARRSASSFSMEQAIQLAQGAEALAAYVLEQDDASQDTAREEWTNPYGPVEVAPEVALEALLTDEQAKFNLNTLLYKDGSVNEPAMTVFLKLLQLLEMESRWADLLVDWLDPDTNTQNSGGEDSLYASQVPAHRTGNAMLASVSELQQLPGMNRELYLRLSPHVTALPPEANKVNVCMADGLVLDALTAVSTKHAKDTEFSRMTPEALKTARARGCFPTTLADSDAEVKKLTSEGTQYFRLRTWVRIGTAQFALYSLMYREGDVVRPISRTFGTE